MQMALFRITKPWLFLGKQNVLLWPPDCKGVKSESRWDKNGDSVLWMEPAGVSPCTCPAGAPRPVSPCTCPAGRHPDPRLHVAILHINMGSGGRSLGDDERRDLEDQSGDRREVFTDTSEFTPEGSTESSTETTAPQGGLGWRPSWPCLDPVGKVE